MDSDSVLVVSRRQPKPQQRKNQSEGSAPASDEQLTGSLALILRAYVHAIPPVTRSSLTVLVRIEGAIHAFLVECLSANRASIDVDWPLTSGSGCTPHAWHVRHRG